MLTNCNYNDLVGKIMIKLAFFIHFDEWLFLFHGFCCCSCCCCCFCLIWSQGWQDEQNRHPWKWMKGNSADYIYYFLAFGLDEAGSWKMDRSTRWKIYSVDCHNNNKYFHVICSFSSSSFSSLHLSPFQVTVNKLFWQKINCYLHFNVQLMIGFCNQSWW